MNTYYQEVKIKPLAKVKKMVKIPYTTFNVLDFTIHKYEQRFLGNIKSICNLSTSLCQFSMTKLVYITGHLYKGNILIFEFTEDWNGHKINDICLYDLLEGHPCFYVIDRENLEDILSTPMQFRYSYKILYDLKKEQAGIETKQIASIKNTPWTSMDEVYKKFVESEFNDPLPLWDTYQLEIRLDPRREINETYYISENGKCRKFKAYHRSPQSKIMSS